VYLPGMAVHMATGEASRVYSISLVHNWMLCYVTCDKSGCYVLVQDKLKHLSVVSDSQHVVSLMQDHSSHHMQ